MIPLRYFSRGLRKCLRVTFLSMPGRILSPPGQHSRRKLQPSEQPHSAPTHNYGETPLCSHACHRLVLTLRAEATVPTGPEDVLYYTPSWGLGKGVRGLVAGMKRSTSRCQGQKEAETNEQRGVPLSREVHQQRVKFPYSRIDADILPSLPRSETMEPSVAGRRAREENSIYLFNCSSLRSVTGL
jgi:hypothetical protein